MARRRITRKIIKPQPKPAQHWACDLEGTVHKTVDGSVKPSDLEVRAWLIGAMNIQTKEFVWFEEISEFVDWCIAQPDSWFHWFNSAGYDGRFIIHELLRQGYHSRQPRWSDENLKQQVKGPFTPLNMTAEQATAMLADKRYFVGELGGFTVYTGNKAVNMVDAMPLLGGSIRMWGDQLGFPKGEETPLLEHGSRLEDLQHADGGYWTMDEAVEYLKRDCEVLARAMKANRVPLLFENGIGTRARLAGDTMWNGGNDITLELKSQPFAPWARIVGDKRWEAKRHRVRKPVKPKPLMDKIIEREIGGTGNAGKKFREIMASNAHKLASESYKGGFNYVNPQFADAWIDEPGSTYDINSMYPWIYGDMELPSVLSGFRGGSLPEEGMYIASFKHLTAEVREGCVPVIKPRNDASETLQWFHEDGNTVNGTYSGRIDYPITLTSVEVEYLRECYDISRMEVAFVFVYEPWDHLTECLRSHRDAWMQAKQESKRGTVAMSRAKLMLSAPYGKLGQHTREYPSHSFKLVDGQYEETIEAMTTGGNAGAELAAASFITAYGRVHLARTINKIGLDKFLYCDTDSVHIKGWWTDEEMLERGVKVHDKKLGAWKLEARWDRAKFIKCKTYGERIIDGVEKRWHTTTAGLGRQIPEEDFAVGYSVQDKRSFAAQGGTVIVDKWLTIGGAAGAGAESWGDQCKRARTLMNGPSR